MSQWNKCWSLHLKLIFILFGLALKIIWISFCIAFLLQYLCVINILNRGLCYLVELDSWKVCRHLHISSLDIDWSTHISRKERSPKNISKDFQNLGFLGLAILRHIQGGFFNWPPPEFAKCWLVRNRFRKNVRVPDWPPIWSEKV